MLTGELTVYYEYGKKELEHLKSRDKVLGEAMDRIGHIYRETEDDVFSSLVHQIIAQQISGAAQATVWARLQERSGTVSAENIYALGAEELQKAGISRRKAGYILELSEKVLSDEFNTEALFSMTDEKAVNELTSLRGVGVWTAEMLLIFCLKRPDIMSFGDLGIRRGMRMLYCLNTLDRNEFDRRGKLYSPHKTVASLYFWAIAGGALPELSDPART